MDSAAQKTVGLCYVDTFTAEGYTLFAPNNNKSTYLIDNCGREVHKWTATDKPRVSAYLTETGNLVRTSKVNSSAWPGGVAGGVEIYDWDNNFLWGIDYTSTEYNRHHDIEPLPNGNILILAYEIKTPTELAAAGRDLFSIGAWYETIIEIEPVGTDTFNIVWEWRMWDHIVQDFDASKPNHGVVADHPELFNLNYVPNTDGPDWVHANSVDYNEELDQIMIGARNFHELWVIDHSTTTAEAASHSGGNSGKGGDLLYRWGNPRAYDRGTAADQKLWRQHDCRWIDPGAPDAGKMMCFSNGLGRTEGEYSTVDVIDPPVDLAGNYTIDPILPLAPDSFYWQYKAPVPEDFYSRNMAGAMQLPNGNYLICSTQQGFFFEVDQAGVEHWRYICPVSNNVITQGDIPMDNFAFRAERYPPDFAGFTGRTLTAGAPIELSPLPYVCPFDEVNCIAPDNLMATILSPSSVGLSWDASPVDIKYQLQGRIAGSPSFAARVSTGNTKVLPGLPAGQTFEWKVRALCSDSSVSPFSALENFTTPALRFGKLDDQSNSAITAWLENSQLNLQANAINEVQLFDLSGRLVLAQKVADEFGNQGQLQLDISTVTQGNYLLQVLTASGRFGQLLWIP